MSQTAPSGGNGTGGGVLRVAGCDLGKAAAKFVVLRLPDAPPGAAAAEVEIESAETVLHEGRPLDAFREWYGSAGIAGCDGLGATGLHADKLRDPVVSGLPEDACLHAALDGLRDVDGPLNLVSVGARGYSVLTRNREGHVQHLENDKCSSGTGETMVKIAGRFGLSIEEADGLASGAADVIPITARCSVFAKSEMTHFGNQGRPADALFRGYFGSVAVYVAALLARGRVEGPVYAIGGGADLETLVAALGDAVGGPVGVAPHHRHLEALGAAFVAGEQARAGRVGALPSDPDTLVRESDVRFEVLETSRHWAHMVTCMEEQPVPDGAGREPAVLGLDLGSTGSKAVLTSLATGEAVLDVYDRTRGNPVDAAQRLIEALLGRTDADVRAIALTGSGREAAATVLRAAFPEATDRILTLNEIVAHATAAIRCDVDGGEDLSVVEIGGQDAKFIQIKGGQIVESDMNKACSAGTGSFLEEQAVFYGIDDVAEFTRLAQTATRPPDLGQMCTVFVAEAASEAHNEGFDAPDLFAGFQYSVIHNYINRVMGQRTFGRRVFFQGKPASGVSLAWTLAAVTGREVVVPPNPGAMGAWGIGLCALDELGREPLAGAPRFELRGALGATVVDRNEFQCRDKRCATLCNIERTKVAVGGAEQTVLSGGACPKYEVSAATRAKLPMEAPSAFDERAAALRPYLEDVPGQRVVGIPAVGALTGYLPWLVTFVRALGLGAKVLAPDHRSLARGEERCYSFDACAPVKVAHGVLAWGGDPDAAPDVVFFPKLLSLGGKEDSGKSCPMEQAMPDMAREALRSRGEAVDIVAPALTLDGDLYTSGLLVQLLDIPARLGGDVPRIQVAEAMRQAAEAQRAHQRTLDAIGGRTLAYGRREGIPVVALCGPLHVIHDSVVNAGIPRLLRENGVLALPMDCFPIPGDTHGVPRMVWSDPKRSLRVAVAARELGDVYPVLLSSFGCGPGSFNEQIFAALMEDYPHTTLESDGHGGSAGYATRVQAFLHTVRRHDGRPSPTPAERLAWLEPLPNPPITEQADARHVLFTIGDKASGILASAYRAFGVNAVKSGPSDSSTLALGRQDCSGKECIPYQLLWGAFRKEIEAASPEEPTFLVQGTGEGACRNCMFSIKDQISVARLGRADSVQLRDFQPESALGPGFMARVAGGLVAWDVLYQLVSYHRPLEGTPGEADAIYARHCAEVEAITGRPGRRGTLAGIGDAGRIAGELIGVVAGAGEDFAALGSGRDLSGFRTVLLSGDFYVRVDEFASDNLVRRLNERGLLVAVEPAMTFMDYVARERMRELVRYPKQGLRQRLTSAGMGGLRKRFYAALEDSHPWLPSGDVPAILAESRRVLDRYPQGEAPVTIGSVMHYWGEAMCDGVVVPSPWGCGPALVSESILRHQRDIPILFVYNDGSPIDERRLNAFAFRLKRDPARTSQALRPAPVG